MWPFTDDKHDALEYIAEEQLRTTKDKRIIYICDVKMFLRNQRNGEEITFSYEGANSSGITDNDYSFGPITTFARNISYKPNSFTIDVFCFNVLKRGMTVRMMHDRKSYRSTYDKCFDYSQASNIASFIIPKEHKEFFEKIKYDDEIEVSLTVENIRALERASS
mgnify:FL=1